MKRLNYYQVHKNKFPRRIKRPQQKSSHIPLVAIMMAMSAIKIAVIQSQIHVSPTTKIMQIVLSAAESALAIAEVIKKIKKTNPKKLYYEKRIIRHI